MAYTVHRTKYFDKQKKESCPNLCPNSTRNLPEFAWIVPGYCPNIVQSLPEMDTLAKLGGGGDTVHPLLPVSYTYEVDEPIHLTGLKNHTMISLKFI